MSREMDSQKNGRCDEDSTVGVDVGTKTVIKTLRIDLQQEHFIPNIYSCVEVKREIKGLVNLLL